MPSSNKKHQLPRLFIGDLDDAEILARKIDLILQADVELRRRAKKIRRLQEELRKAIGNGDNFVIYLRLEEEVNARGAHALDVVTAWAFTEGLRVGRQPDLDDLR